MTPPTMTSRDEGGAGKPLVIGCVQARMGSTRLPGKALVDIAGLTMLHRVTSRLGRALGVDEVVIATSTHPDDDAIVRHGADLGLRVFRGGEMDVLGRYALVTRATGADLVVRVTSDCPFLDPVLASTVVAAVTDGVDYAANNLEPRTFPRGLDVEVMTAAALLEADRLDVDPGTREHVTPFIRDSGRYHLAAVSHDPDLSTIRWTVDTVEDLELARTMADHFDGRNDMSWEELLGAWNSHPSWWVLNDRVEQKPVIRTMPHDHPR